MARSRYLVSPRVDLPLIVGAPFLCAAVLLPLATVVPTESLWFGVMALGGVGHHLPGFLRTYGDGELWRRFRLRFLLAPPLIFAATLWCALRDLHAMALLSLVWSIWHGMMQHYGFVRIYDAKEREPGAGAISARLDWLLAASWFLLCLVWSPSLAASVLQGLAQVQLPPIPPMAYALFAKGITALTAAITVAYLAALLRAPRPGAGVLKLGLIATTTSFVFFARVVTTDPFLSVALFELLHDVQYLSIVWAFNRRRASSSGELRPLLRRLFSSGRLAPFAYLGACLAYGAIAFVPSALTEGTTLKAVLLAALTTSGLLHFYYDGFIWKMRDPDTRRGLQLEGSGPIAKRRSLGVALPALGIAAVLLLVFLERRPVERDPLESAANMVELVPRNATARNELGALLLEGQQFDRAAEQLEQAVALQPQLASAQANLGVALLGLHRPQEALAALETAKRLRPGLEGVARNTGDALVALGRYEDARASYRAVSGDASADPGMLFRLAVVDLHLGQTDQAREELQRALALDPDYAPAREQLQQLSAPTP